MCIIQNQISIHTCIQIKNPNSNTRSIVTRDTHFALFGMTAVQYDLVLTSSQIDADCLGLCITRQRGLPKLTTDT